MTDRTLMLAHADTQTDGEAGRRGSSEIREDRRRSRCPASPRPFAGRWRIVEMDNWGSDFLDLVEEAHLTFEGKSDGEIAFGALKGFLDVRYGARDGWAFAEFSWEGHDENDPACGRGWVMMALRAGASATSTYTMATIQASFANAAEFFNSLPGPGWLSSLSGAVGPWV